MESAPGGGCLRVAVSVITALGFVLGNRVQGFICRKSAWTSTQQGSIFLSHSPLCWECGTQGHTLSIQATLLWWVSSYNGPHFVSFRAHQRSPWVPSWGHVLPSDELWIRTPCCKQFIKATMATEFLLSCLSPFLCTLFKLLSLAQLLHLHQVSFPREGQAEAWWPSEKGRDYLSL